MTTEVRTWQSYKDEDCVPDHFFPCGIDMSETITTSLVTINWGKSDLVDLPRSDVLGCPNNLYFEIRRVDGSGPVFAAGDLILTESVER